MLAVCAVALYAPTAAGFLFSGLEAAYPRLGRRVRSDDATPVGGREDGTYRGDEPGDDPNASRVRRGS